MRPSDVILPLLFTAAACSTALVLHATSDETAFAATKTPNGATTIDCGDITSADGKTRATCTKQLPPTNMCSEGADSAGRPGTLCKAAQRTAKL